MDDLFEREHTKEAKDERGEVFTPEALVEEMLGKLPKEFFTSADKTVLDNSCGNGNFLVKVLEWRLKHNVPHLDALKTIYGVELDEANAAECRQRLSLGKKDSAIWDVLNRNIVCADALNPSHAGWRKVGYLWDEKQAQVEQLFFDWGD